MLNAIPFKCTTKQNPVNSHSSILSPKCNWICGHCLVGCSLQFYDEQLKSWKNVAVISFNEERKIHTVKHWQETFTVYLKEYRVRPMSNSSLLLDHSMNRQTNSTVLEVKDDIRHYRRPRTPEDVLLWNYHSQPQVVGFSPFFFSLILLDLLHDGFRFTWFFYRFRDLSQVCV